jgi:tetratricopeptide (TPR) repeat protein
VNTEMAFRNEAVLKQQLHQAERNLERVIWDLAEFYSRTSQPQLASKHVDRLLSITGDPERKAGCYLAMGQLMEQQNDFESAAAFYSQAYPLEPTTSRTWYFINNNLGYCLNQLGRHKEAEPYCRAAILIDPMRYNAYKNLGVALQGQGCWADAAYHYLHAIEASPGEPRAFRHLEALASAHPEIRQELPGIDERLIQYGIHLSWGGDSPV